MARYNHSDLNFLPFKVLYTAYYFAMHCKMNCNSRSTKFRATIILTSQIQILGQILNWEHLSTGMDLFWVKQNVWDVCILEFRPDTIFLLELIGGAYLYIKKIYLWTIFNNCRDYVLFTWVGDHSSWNFLQCMFWYMFHSSI